LSDTSQGAEWWLASDGRWYPPADNSGHVLAPPEPSYAGDQYSGSYPGPPFRPTNALAIASLILSIVWFFGLGSVLAVTFALVALSKITASKGGQAGKGLAVAGLIIGICGLIGSVAFFVILNGHLSANDRLNDQPPASRLPPVTLPATAKPPASTIGPPVTLPAAVRTQSTVNPLGVTLNVTDPSGHDFAKVLVLDVAYPVSLGVGSYAIASVGVCAGQLGSQTAPSSYGFVLGVSGGQEVHTAPDSIPSLAPNACTDAELFLEIPPGTTPTYVAYHQYRWSVPAH
jgi:hypothetical protein